MSSKLFLACILPVIECAVVFLAACVRQEGLELPAGVLAAFAVMPFIGVKG